MDICEEADCDSEAKKRGLCEPHYYRAIKSGTLEIIRPLVLKDWRINFWKRVDKDGPNGCWIWQGACDQHGYGSMTIDYKRHKAHRLAFELLKEPLIVGMVLDHLCRNPACVNPDHLEQVSQKENVRRGDAVWVNGLRNAQKTHCKNGHAFTSENTYRPKSGGRVCRKCMVMWQRQYQQRRAGLITED